MDELRYLLALSAVRGVGPAIVRHLLSVFGSAEALFHADKATLMQLPRVGELLARAVSDPKTLARADRELQFMAEHHVRTYIYGQEGYSQRLMNCPDAPLVLFELGQPLTAMRHVVSIVGTRNCSQYGRDMTDAFVRDLHELVPDLVIVSGLAYGIDVTAHRAALRYGVPTVAVVAHGLDRIYPSQHRDEARQMIAEGGAIVTEYMTGTEPERGNFLARNRIIAGLADAVLVAESKSKGGSLVTAALAFDYNRDVFAFPNRVGDNRCEGCNQLIRLNRASLVTCAQDLVMAMNWDVSPRTLHSVQTTINFVEDNLSSPQRLILDILRDRDELRLAELAELSGIDSTTLTELLLDLEMEGRVRSCPGGGYQMR